MLPNVLGLPSISFVQESSEVKSTSTVKANNLSVTIATDIHWRSVGGEALESQIAVYGYQYPFLYTDQA